MEQHADPGKKRVQTACRRLLAHSLSLLNPSAHRVVRSSTMYKHVALLLILGVAGAAAQMRTNKPLLEAIEGNAQLSQLAAAIKTSPDLVKALSAPDFSGTIFAPNDKAFENALAAAMAANVDVGPLLEPILSYHVVPGAPAFSANLADGDKLVTADQGEELTVAFVDGKPLIEGVGSSAGIVTPDIAVGDKVAVHIIDTVLLPIELPAPEDSMAPAPAPMEADNDIEMPDDMAQGPTPAVISARRIYKSVVSAIDNEGLTSLAAALTATDLAGSLGPTFNGTVFAPTNDAVAAAVEALDLDLSNLSSDDMDALTTVLLYHVLPEVYFSKDLPTGDTLVDTLGGAPLTVQKRANGVKVMDAAGQKCSVIKADIVAGDAVVHVIDCVLSPVALAPGPNAAPASSASSTVVSIAALAASLLVAALAM
ncbi:hypothetical protein D9Q98_005864 [Chlorella vulgaris]|uniref:FAS1 domain-containing protein n=1 Tax=Chlorella vulgaris TaxID=3077 RepID=A0A9D4TXN0_CHLVU|nr:hypothetical protein D9Q98_005864 [Chlorella vulgaris]